MSSEGGLTELDDIEESFEVSGSEEMDSSPESVDIDDVGADDLEASVNAPEPSSLTPPQAFRCERCGATFPDEGALMEHLQHCASDEEEAKTPQIKPA